MKKIKVFIAMVVFVLALQTGTKAWSSDAGHANLIENGIVASGKSVSSTDRKIMKKAAYLADKGSAVTASGLHGVNHNSYVVDTKFLYEVAMEYKKNNSNALQTVINRYADNKTVSIRKNHPTAVRTIDESVKAIVSDSEGVTKYFKDITTSNSNKVKSLKVLGLALHNAGDVYAHKTIVPVSAIDPVSAKKTSAKVGHTDFNTNATVCGWGNKDTTLITNAELNLIFHNGTNLSEDYYNKNKGDKTNIYAKYYTMRYNWPCFKRAVRNGVVETRDITRVSRLKSDGSFDGKYEDGTDFLPTRYTIGARYAVKRIITNYVDETRFSSYTFLQYAGQETNKHKLKLYNLKKNYEVAGINTPNVTAAQWNVMSADSVK